MSSTVQDPSKARVHNRPYTLKTSKSGVRKVVKALSHRAAAKVGTLPDGGWATIVRCLHTDSKGTVSIIHRVAGSDGMREGLEAYANEILNSHGTAFSEEAPASKDTIEQYYTVPGNAEKRAAKVRQFLKEAWERHVQGTTFAKTKQMYRAVNELGAPAFPWWDSVTDNAPFNNVSVAIPEVSHKLAAYLGPLLASVDIPTSPEVPREPHEQCTRNPLCTNHRGHRGRCTLPRVVPEALVPSEQEQLADGSSTEVAPSLAPPTPMKLAAKKKKHKKKKALPPPREKAEFNNRAFKAKMKKAQAMNKTGFTM